MRKLLLTSALVFLQACAPSYYTKADGCRTPCGATVKATSLSEEQCNRLADYENITVEILSPMLNDPERFSLCKRLSLYTVEIMDTHGTNAWVDNWGRLVGGLTFPEYSLMQIGSTNWPESAFAHEAVHSWSVPDGDPDHVEWKERGIYDAIARINARYAQP